MSSLPPAELPAKLGSFEIAGVLGEGGSAVVYSARDGEREVALKVLHPEIGLEPKVVDRFLDEADRMRRVQHRALVPVIRAGLLPGGRPYIAMPRLAGKTLAAFLASGPLPLALALRLFEDLVDGLATLHDAGLVHRDIKPENVFYLEAEARLVLLDLGIARETSSGPSTTTKAGMMRGTPAYMAPERFLGRPASVASDVFELGLLLYVMLTCSLPWKADDAGGRLQPMTAADRGVLLPAAFSDALMRALHADVSKRPIDARALLALLRASVGSGGDALGSAPTEIAQTPPRTPTPEVRVEPRATTNSPMLPDAAAVLPPAGSAGGGRLLLMGAGIALVAAFAGALASGMLPRPGAGTVSSVAGNATGSAEEASVPPRERESTADASSTPSVREPATRPELSVSPSPLPSAPPQVVESSPTASERPSKPATSRNAPACDQLQAQMCSPTSGALPTECEPAKEMVAALRRSFPDPAELQATCAKYAASSGAVLAKRRASGGPPSGSPP